MRIRFFIDVFLLLWAMVLLAWLGMVMPVHFRAVSPLVLEEAARGTPTATDLVDELLAAGRVGPAALVGESLPRGMEEAQRQRASRLRAGNPAYSISGGPAPYFIQFLDSVSYHPEEAAELIPFLLPRERREVMAGFLAHSSNELVRDLLRTRELPGWARFLPAYSEAGHPLDATILSAALLEQSGRFPAPVSRRLREITRESLAAESASRDLERFLLGVFSLGKRMSFASLAELVAHCPDADTFYRVAALLHQEEGGARLPEFYAAALLTDDLAGLVEYLRFQREDGWRALRLALTLGEGAVRELLTFDKPLYEPSPLLSGLSAHITRGGEFFQGFAQRNPRSALAAKLAAFFGSGFALAVLFSRVAEVSHRRPVASYRNPLFLASNAAVAFIVAVLLWVAVEPELLHFQENREAVLRIDLASVVGPVSLPSHESESDMIDQVTLLILLLFFVTQLAIFVFCMIRIREVKKQSAHPELKIRLLENEEHLFDLGLYVGLGGTVAALILVVLNVVEASLMAAYASTLFGIIFVALLKVIFLRPYRRQLILLSGNGQTSAAPARAGKSGRNVSNFMG